MHRSPLCDPATTVNNLQGTLPSLTTRILLGQFPSHSCLRSFCLVTINFQFICPGDVHYPSQISQITSQITSLLYQQIALNCLFISQSLDLSITAENHCHVQRLSRSLPSSSTCCTPDIYVLLLTLVVSSSNRKNCSTRGHAQDVYNSACSDPLHLARCCRLSWRLDIKYSSPICSLRVGIQPKRSQQLKISRPLRTSDLGCHYIP
jgi:hypothetical protein